MDEGRITVRDLAPADVAALKDEAAELGVSLNRLAAETLHRRARTARNRRLLRAVGTAGHDPVEVDAVAEVRALREGRDERAAELADDREASR